MNEFQMWLTIWGIYGMMGSGIGWTIAACCKKNLKVFNYAFIISLVMAMFGTLPI